MLDGLRDEPLDLVVTVCPNVDPFSLGRQPANVQVERYVPKSLLLPRCSAIVCHGGYGTLLAAIEHAIPVVVVPFGADQPINARSIERLGLGRVIEEEDETAERLRAAVQSVLHEPAPWRNVEQVRDEAATLPPNGEALATLEWLVRPSVRLTSSYDNGTLGDQEACMSPTPNSGVSGPTWCPGR